MTEIWYRPKGTIGPSQRFTNFDLWYRQGANGRPETTTTGREDWLRTAQSVEFQTMEEMLRSGICIHVKDVGCRTPLDPDLIMDEGL